MSPEFLQISLAAFASSFLGMAIYRLARIGRLSFRYAVGWLSICGLGLFAIVLIPFIQPISNRLRVSPAVLFGLAAAVVFVGICIQLSISISGMQEHIRRLTEQSAHLKIEVDELVSNLEKPDAHKK